MKRYGILLAVVALLAATSVGQAQTTLYWDINGTSDGASGAPTAAGTWNTGITANWNTDPTGLAGGTVTTWTAGDNAIFAAGANATASYTVTPVGTVFVGNLTVEDTGGNNTLTLSATGSPTIFFNSGATLTISNAAILTMASNMDGAGGLIKEGPGRLFITGTNNLAGTYTVNGGSIAATSDAGFGPVPGAVDADYFLLNGGMIRAHHSGAGPTSLVTLDANRGITLGANGGTLVAGSISGNAVTLTVNGIIAGTSGGALKIDRVDGPSTPAASGNGIVRLMAANTYDGQTQIAANATLQVGASGGVIPDTSVVTLSNSSQFQLNGFDETVKSVSGTAGTTALGDNTLTLANPAGESMNLISSTVNGKFIKNGSGALTLLGGSTGFNGEFILNAGSLGIGNTNNFGGTSNTGTFTINAGTLFNTANTGRSMNVQNVNIAGNFTLDGPLSGLPNPGNIDFNGGSGAAIITLKTNPIITVLKPTNEAAGFLIFGGTVQDDGTPRGFTKAGDGVLTLTNTNNSYRGDTIIQAGQLRIDSDSTLGDGTGTLVLSGGSLVTTAGRGVNSDPVPNPINLTTSSTIATISAAAAPDLNFTSNSIGGTGTLTFRNDAPSGTGTFEPRFSAGDLTIDLPIALEANDSSRNTRLSSFNTVGTTQTFNGVISGTGAFRRSATAPAGVGGTTVFTAANTYEGTTSVNDGTLLVNNTSGSGTGSGAVVVGNGVGGSPDVGTLGGSGSISGSVVVNYNGVVTPGNSAGTLTVGDMTLNPGTDPAEQATLEFELGSIAASDKIIVTTTNGLTVNDALFNITGLGGFGPGTYTLIDYDGLAFGAAMGDNDLNDLLGTTPAGFTYNLFNNDSMGVTAIQLEVIGAATDFAGDYNDDGIVDAADYVMWRHAEANPDFNLANDSVNPGFDPGDDLIWEANFGNEEGGGSAQGGAVPEPATLALAVLGLALAGVSRRQRI